ncbi:MAG: tRNA (adenosine(37)-N6)-threonylcarbamoyltransferase complex ATPase subunit type 1 TsaE [Bacteroidia bacterium]|nr:tRNA (adenosine(37)-N6)-threonylcarbamoyltransferase complex ATPase subunit type 1 TsaE [Bacteroidia bacterium]
MVAEKLLAFAGDCKVFLLNAQMGAGKTTFIKHLCKQLGSTDDFSSPSFSIVNEYHSPKGKIYHFDLYRIKTTEELFDIGVEDYLDSGAFCFIEWPALIEDLINVQHSRVNITCEGQVRHFHFRNL